MSSSPSRVQAEPSASTAVREELSEASPFPYLEVAASSSGVHFRRAEFPGESAGAATQGAEREAQARELGRKQGESESRAKFEEQVARERSAVAKALAEFPRDRAAYYQKIEEEAVRLALSIARKVLHREAQVDPLLLMGIVRVALERIEGATSVILAVHPPRAEDWHRYLASRMEPGDVPEIVEDPALGPEQCQLRTSMGTAEMGLEVQLKEIEQGLMDLLAARPQGKP
jgi:flagellar assembly protein FliH